MNEKEVKRIFKKEWENNFFTMDLHQLIGEENGNEDSTAIHEAGHFFIAEKLGAKDICFSGFHPYGRTYYVTDYRPITDFLIALAGMFSQFKFYSRLNDKKLVRAIVDVCKYYTIFQPEEKNDVTDLFLNMEKHQREFKINSEYFFFDFFPENIVVLDKIFKEDKQRFLQILDEAREFYTKQVIWGRFNASPIFFKDS